jgi:hypothetical protein
LANITSTPSIVSPTGAPYGYYVATYGPMANGDVGIPVPMDTTNYSDISAQVTGTFGTGGSVAIEGSNDKVNWAALRDPSHTTIAITSAAIQAVLENTIQVRPHVTAGDGNTSLTVTLMYRRTY